MPDRALPPGAHPSVTCAGETGCTPTVAACWRPRGAALQWSPADTLPCVFREGARDPLLSREDDHSDCRESASSICEEERKSATVIRRLPVPLPGTGDRRAIPRGRAVLNPGWWDVRDLGKILIASPAA